MVVSCQVLKERLLFEVTVGGLVLAVGVLEVMVVLVAAVMARDVEMSVAPEGAGS